MKIQCDVCEKKEATVFCAADEAALCEGCDKRVHHANKLATKHLRFPLLHPSFSNHAPPLCDICQERRAFLFCREDRAILCRECDIPIHIANEHTQTHTRFLLTGVKLSSSSFPYPNPCPPSSDCSNPDSNRMTSVTATSHNHEMFNQCLYTSNDDTTTPLTTTAPTTTTTNCNQINEEGSLSTSNLISEYLMETLPGWRLEDLLDPSSSASHHNLCKPFDSTKAVNEKQEVEEVMDPFGSEDYARLWEVHEEGPYVPSSHLHPIFLRTLS